MFRWTCLPSVLWHCWLGVRKSIRPVKILSDEVLAWLFLWSMVQMICIWSSWCHCHPIIFWAMYKLALITFNALQHNNPMYLRHLLTTHNPSRNLRSSSQHLLSVGYMRTVSSSRCFKHSAAINWNDLPFDIRACDSVNVFKRKLKSHLFNIAT